MPAKTGKKGEDGGELLPPQDEGSAYGALPTKGNAQLSLDLRLQPFIKP
jgi:hypothetical protein